MVLESRVRRSHVVSDRPEQLLLVVDEHQRAVECSIGLLPAPVCKRLLTAV